MVHAMAEGLRQHIATQLDDLPEDMLEKVNDFIAYQKYTTGLYEGTTPDSFYSKENIELLKRRAANLEASGGAYHELIEVDDE